MEEEEEEEKMKKSASEQSFYIESDEEDEEKVLNRDGQGEDYGYQSDSDDSVADNQQQNKTGSYNTSWPQSYRSLFLFLSPFVFLCSVLFSVILCLN